MDARDTTLDLPVARLHYATAINLSRLLDRRCSSSEAGLHAAENALKAQKKHEEAAEEMVKMWQNTKGSICREIESVDKELHEARNEMDKEITHMCDDLRYQTAHNLRKLLNTSCFFSEAGLNAAKNALMVQKKHVEADEELVKMWRTEVEASRHQSKCIDKQVSEAYRVMDKVMSESKVNPPKSVIADTKEAEKDEGAESFTARMPTAGKKPLPQKSRQSRAGGGKRRWEGGGRDKKKRQREEAIDVDAEAGSEKAEPHK